MPDYTKNHQTSLSGHTGEGEPTVHSDNSGISKMADVRDLLNAIVGAGKDGLRPDDRSAVYNHLGSILGKEAAQKLITQTLLFNQRADVGGKSAQQRITQFYEMGSSDPSTNKIITQTKMLGQGPVVGADQSSNDLTKKVMQGKDVLSTSTANASNDNQLQAGRTKAAGGF